ncbi:MAG: UDP-N-acetylmuramoyl-L-alanine--D-glutamate ligase [Alphaproteobacteria bacterium]
MNFSNKKYLILGMGVSGQTTRDWLLRKDAIVLCHDDLDNSIPIDDIPWKKLEAVIVSPGIPFASHNRHPFVKRAVDEEIKIITDINLLQQNIPNAYYIGITGTNGKSTTAALITHVLRSCNFDVSFGGNIGVAALTLPRSSIYILELSSYQLERSQPLRFDSALWLNFSENHLEQHGNIDEYFLAKKRIFINSRYNIIGIDDSFSQKLYNEYNNKRTTLSVSSISNKADIFIHNDQLFNGDRVVFDKTGLKTLSTKCHTTALAFVYVVCHHIFSIPSYQIYKSIKSFKTLEHRLEIVATKNNITFVNDSKATTPIAAAYAICNFKGKKIFWIVGGQAKSKDFSTLLPYLSYIEHAFIIGEAKELLFNAFNKKVTVTLSDTLLNAVKSAHKMALKEKSAVILLSPGCASFDQFNNFEHRGNAYKNFVKDYL